MSHSNNTKFLSLKLSMTLKFQSTIKRYKKHQIKVLHYTILYNYSKIVAFFEFSHLKISKTVLDVGFTFCDILNTGEILKNVPKGIQMSRTESLKGPLVSRHRNSGPINQSCLKLDFVRQQKCLEQTTFLG